MSHRSSSASFAGRCDKVLYDAYPGYRNAVVALQPLSEQGAAIFSSLDAPDDAEKQVEYHVQIVEVYGSSRVMEVQERGRFI